MSSITKLRTRPNSSESVSDLKRNIKNKVGTKTTTTKKTTPTPKPPVKSQEHTVSTVKHGNTEAKAFYGKIDFSKIDVTAKSCSVQSHPLHTEKDTKTAVGYKLVSGEAGLLKMSGDYKHGGWNASAVSGSGEISVSKKDGFQAYAKASLAEAGGNIKVPIPFTNKQAVIGADVDIGSIGGGVKYSKKDGVTLGEHFGVGADIKLDLENRPTNKERKHKHKR